MLSLCPRDRLGGWSNQLVANGEDLADKRVLMDGPFGELAVRPERYTHAAVICAGVSYTKRPLPTPTQRPG